MHSLHPALYALYGRQLSFRRSCLPFEHIQRVETSLASRGHESVTRWVEIKRPTSSNLRNHRRNSMPRRCICRYVYHEYTIERKDVDLSRDGDLDLDTGLQADAGLKKKMSDQRGGKGREVLTICLTISLDECRSMRRLCTLSS